MQVTFANRAVTVEYICHSSDPADSYVGAAYWTASGLALSDITLQELTWQLQADGTMEEEQLDYQCIRAEDAADLAADR